MFFIAFYFSMMPITTYFLEVVLIIYNRTAVKKEQEWNTEATMI